MESMVYAALFLGVGKMYLRAGNNNFNDAQQAAAHFARKYLRNSEAADLIDQSSGPNPSVVMQLDIALQLSGLAEIMKLVETPESAMVRLHSSLAGVRGIREIIGSQEPHGYKPLMFSPDHPYPIADIKQAQEKGNYHQCLQELEQAVFNYAGGNSTGRKRYYQLYQLLEDYTRNIPARTDGKQSDVALFDLARTTAAIAAALYQQQLSEQELQDLRQGLETEADEYWYLLTGDLSGIQDFVYELTSKGATRGLRGRSFYIFLVAEAIAHSICRAEGLPPCNVLFSGGGHFHLLLPASARERMPIYQQQVEEILFSAHHGSLSLVLAGAGLSCADFLNTERFGQRWKLAGDGLQTGKKQKFLRLLRQEPQSILGPYYDGQQICSVCGGKGREAEEKCSFCQSFENLGESMTRNSHYLLFYEIELQQKASIRSVDDVLAAFGWRVRFSRDADPNALVAAINCRITEQEESNFSFWMANITPRTDHGTIATFDDLARRSQGYQTWGVLRGDVDNLGRVFSEGLGANRSIARVASLSREISFFFSRMLNDICNQYAQQIYVIYAGGDDFFLVGSWNVLPLVAADIRREFERYSGYNPNLTLSCAISQAPAVRYPLFKVAQDAGEDLDDRAKSSRNVQGQPHSKDSIVFLGELLTWQELEETRKIKELIVKAIREEGCSKALLQIIYSGYIEQVAFDRGSYPLNRIWHLAYNLGRLAARTKSAQNSLMQLENRLVQNHVVFNRLGAYAARWAEKELRTGGYKE